MQVNNKTVVITGGGLGIGRALAERMIRLESGGVIINISSVSRHGNAGQSNYSAARAGVAALSVVWAKELARFGIRTGTIAPGGVRTEILASMRPDISGEVVGARAAAIDMDGGFRI